MNIQRIRNEVCVKLISLNRMVSVSVVAGIVMALLLCGCTSLPDSSRQTTVSNSQASNSKGAAKRAIPDGFYSSTSSDDEMIVHGDEVRLRRGKSTWAVLSNNGTGKSLFDHDDLAQVHPCQLHLRDSDHVEYIRDAVPPFPEQRLMFEKVKSEAEFAQKYVENGRRLLLGDGVDKSNEEAIKLFTMAAAKNHPEAQYWLGRIYLSGWGGQENAKEAVSWFRKAADQGFVKGQTKLGLCYLFADGVEEDHQEAIRWLRIAAQQDDVEAQYWLGVACENGYGVPKNVKEALRWYQKAAEQGAGKISEMAVFRVNVLKADSKRRAYICYTLIESGIKIGKEYWLVTRIDESTNYPKRDKAIKIVNENIPGNVWSQDVLFWDETPKTECSTILLTSEALYCLQDAVVKKFALEDIDTIHWERKKNGCVLVNGTPCKVVVDYRKPFVEAMTTILARIREEDEKSP